MANRRLARDTYCVRLQAQGLARSIRPGQFLMLRLPGTTDPLLGRPFALCDTVLDAQGQAVAVDCRLPGGGQAYRLVGAIRSGRRRRGLGSARQWFSRASGTRSRGARRGWYRADALPCLYPRTARPAWLRRHTVLSIGCLCTTAFAQRNWPAWTSSAGPGAVVHLATDDGSLGFRGFVTQLLEQQEKPHHLIGCGPEPMMKALAMLAQLGHAVSSVAGNSDGLWGRHLFQLVNYTCRTGDGWDYGGSVWMDRCSTPRAWPGMAWQRRLANERWFESTPSEPIRPR